MPNIPYGKVPNSDFSSNDNFHLGTKVGIITRVDELHLKADVRVISGAEERFEIDLTQAMAGPRSFLGGIPEVNSMVLIGYRRKKKQIYDAVILGYIPMGNLLGMKFDPLATIPPDEVDPEDVQSVKKIYGDTLRYKRVRGNQGDILGMAAAGAEMRLSKDVYFVNRAGDSFELRDVDRTIVTQALHQVHNDAASYIFSGAIRRGSMNLPLSIFQVDKDGNPTNVLKDVPDRYFGRDELAAAGVPPTTYANASGTVLDRINNEDEFPAVTYSNNRQVFFASDTAATNFEDPLEGGSLRAFTERRMEIRHDTDLLTEVLDEIDGFGADRPRTYIEQVYGTVVGNDPFSTLGQRQYGRVLKPKLFEDFDQTAPPSGFRLEECLRPPSTAIDEALTMAGAYLFKMTPPRSASRNEFAMAVSKQGKVFLNIPGSTSENYPSKNISAEVNAAGALKMRLGAANPDRISLHLTLEGGIFADIGPNANGECITTNFRGAVKNIFRNGNGVDGFAHSVDVQGNSEKNVSGDDVQTVRGAYQKNVDGGYNVQANAVKMNGVNGYTGNFGAYTSVISGKTQTQHAQQVQETIATGGKTSTILAGPLTQNLTAGSMSTTVTAGSTTFSNPAGPFTVSVGTGAISMTTTSGSVTLSTSAGAVSISASSGAVSITAGLAMNLSATTSMTLSAPQIFIGGSSAALGVARGTAALPPGAPSLDLITGSPLQGCAVIRSL
jgi:hypothetical protein